MLRVKKLLQVACGLAGVAVLAALTPRAYTAIRYGRQLYTPASAPAERVAVVDFDVFVAQVRSGRLLGATDVFPEEPVPASDPVRSVEDMMLSAHRTGGMKEALYNIGRLTVADAELILRGLPPQMCRRADPAVASRQRSKPVSIT